MRDDEIAQKLKDGVRAKMAAFGELGDHEPFALSAAWPDPVLALSHTERDARVRKGADTVILRDENAPGGARGFVRAVLRVPLDHPKATVFGVFVEVDRDAYLELQRAFRDNETARVWGTLATKLPLIDEAFGARVLVEEDGGELRARVIDSDSKLIKLGSNVGS